VGSWPVFWQDGHRANWLLIRQRGRNWFLSMMVSNGCTNN
jgi:hypothetical protein